MPNNDNLDPPSVGRILLAEDDSANRMVAVHMLEALGFEVDAVANGVEAVESVKVSTYIAAVMDVNMQMMDGIEAVRLIRTFESRAGRSRMPIICVTARALEGDRERFLAAGMDDYLAKPYSLDEFERKLTSLTRVA